MQDGGFCGHRASGLNMDLTGYDGLRLRIKGDGNRYKLNLKTTDAMYQAPECVYQVRFLMCRIGYTYITLHPPEPHP